jgi:hypothetical protein
MWPLRVVILHYVIVRVPYLPPLYLQTALSRTCAQFLVRLPLKSVYGPNPRATNNSYMRIAPYSNEAGK